MEHRQWDWDIGKKKIADFHQWRDLYKQVQEPVVSPDGETLAAVVEVEDMVFSVCENGKLWENTFDRIWYPRFGPDSRLAALVSTEAAWTVATADCPWEAVFDFVWDPRFSACGGHISAAAQNEGQYNAVTDGVAWNASYPSLSGLAMANDGTKTAAVVQTVPFNSGDIFQFQEGCYSAAVNGKPWEHNFLNLWELNFSPDGRSLAAEARTTLYDYTIVVDGMPWPASFESVWKPVFHPADGSVTAPVRKSGKWFLAKNGAIIWEKPFLQLWHHQYSRDGRCIAAIVAPAFGKWTVAVDSRPWSLHFSDLVTDLAISPDGNRVACVGCTDGRWAVAVDNRCWNDRFDMVWQPVFSPDSRHVAAKVEKQGRFFILVNGRPLKQTFSELWDPVFSPDSTRLMVRGIEDQNSGHYCRYVFQLSDLV